MFDIQFNMDDLLAELDRLSNELPTAVDQALLECGQVIADEESKRTKGKLSQSFFVFKEGDSVIVDNKKDYAEYIEFGRGPVTAIHAKALRFVIGGEVIFRKSVGPAKAQPFISSSIKAATGRFNDIFHKHIDRLIK